MKGRWEVGRGELLTSPRARSLPLLPQPCPHHAGTGLSSGDQKVCCMATRVSVVPAEGKHGSGDLRTPSFLLTLGGFLYIWNKYVFGVLCQLKQYSTCQVCKLC